MKIYHVCENCGKEVVEFCVDHPEATIHSIAETKFFMNSVSGVVQTEADWHNDHKNTPSELWGGPDFEDAELFEVELDENGDWVEA